MVRRSVLFWGVRMVVSSLFGVKDFDYYDLTCHNICITLINRKKVLGSFKGILSELLR